MMFFPLGEFREPGVQSQETSRLLRYAEYGLLVIIICIIVLFLLNEVGDVHKKAERMAVLGQINTMRGEVMATVDSDFSDDSAGSEKFLNPVRIMQRKPSNYLGVISRPEQLDIPPGSWYYNTQTGFLVYKAKHELEFPFKERRVAKIKLALMTLEQAKSSKTTKILSCGPKLCLTAGNIQ